MTDDAYGRIARFYDPVAARTSRALAGAVARAAGISPGERVLDVGCGTGVQLEVYASHGARCWGVDLSPAMLDVARRRLADLDVRLELADATNLSFGDGSFDVVTTTMLLHELEPHTADAIIGQMRRLSSSGGRMVIVDYATDTLTPSGRARRVLSTVVERLAGRGHYVQWRSFLRRGGVPALLPIDLEVRSERHLGGGNLAVWVIGGRR
jgi:ubiquinone/menaquinone biosynthesis C-methylase UbiE